MKKFYSEEFERVIRDNIKVKKSFRIEGKEGELAVINSGEPNPFALPKFILNRLKPLDLSRLNEKELIDILRAIDLSIAILDYFYPKGNNESEALILALRLGGKIPSSYLEEGTSDITFLKKNQFDKLVLPLRVNIEFVLGRGVKIPFVFPSGERGGVFFNEMEWLPLFNEKNQVCGYRFYHQGKWLFQTDTSLCLTRKFTLVQGGIVFHDVEKAPGTIFCYQEGEGGEFLIAFAIDKNQKNSLTFLMKNGDGQVYSFGIEKGKLICPSYQVIPYSLGSVALQIPVTQSEWQRVFEEIKDVRDKSTKGLKENFFLTIVERQLSLTFQGKRRWLRTFWKDLAEFTIRVTTQDGEKRVCYLVETQ